MIVIDGSQGEGGGQVLRTALSLSMVTGRAFRIFDIRARRTRPGLQRQHLTAVQSATALASADVEGADLGALDITFSPRHVRPGRYTFDVGTAGSTTLIAQTLIPPLVVSGADSHITLVGGTHNPMSPPFEFLDRAYLPLLRRMGADIHAQLITPGFYPAGGGRFEITIGPASRLSALELSSRGKLVAREAHAVVSRLPLSIAQREIDVIRDLLMWPDEVLLTREERHSKGPGNVVIATLAFENVTEVFAGFGERGVPAEKVATDMVNEMSEFLGSQAAVGSHLADQLLIPMALAGGGRIITLPPSRHTVTNAKIIETFLPVSFSIEPSGDGLWSIALR